MSDPVRIAVGVTSPSHVAIIMDGNGRWAERRGLPRLAGHRSGADTVREITTASRKLGLKYLTLYSFSVQNWQRPMAEVSGLMDLLEEYCVGERDLLMQNGIRLNVVGGRSRLPESTRLALEKLCDATKENTDMVLTLAIDYGGREELLQATRAMGEAVAKGELIPEDINEDTLSSYLWTHDMPDPDLLIRTSGEVRLSNFLLWQSAYTELLFTDVLWPDFDPDQFVGCVEDFNLRQRRYGATAEQIDDCKALGSDPC